MKFEKYITHSKIEFSQYLFQGKCFVSGLVSGDILQDHIFIYNFFFAHFTYKVYFYCTES